jgi:hypothetical protein
MSHHTTQIVSQGRAVDHTTENTSHHLLFADDSFTQSIGVGIFFSLNNNYIFSFITRLGVALKEKVSNCLIQQYYIT